jgi:hypothetical protein
MVNPPEGRRIGARCSKSLSRFLASFQSKFYLISALIDLTIAIIASGRGSGYPFSWIWWSPAWNIPRGTLPASSCQNLNIVKVEIQMVHETINAGFRIPDLNAASFDGAVQWFTEMANHGLLFHPDDDPADIVVIKTGEPMFSDQEAESARLTLDRLFETLGEDVYEAACPVMREACGFPAEMVESCAS